MKKLFTLLFLLSLGNLSLWAEGRSEQEASAIACSFLQKKAHSRGASTNQEASLTLVYTAKDENGRISYYAYNRQGGGFVVVSGESRYSYDVVGYSEKGFFDYENLPKELRWMLDGLAEDISQSKNRTVKKKAVTRSATVEPLLGETAWNQYWPYNLMTPTINGEHCATGCVNTATAQVMYYHRWPERGKGTPSYDWNGQTLSVDLSQSVYRWDLMTPTYDSNSSQESCDAVALLMRDIGYASYTNYGVWESGVGEGWNGRALINYFDYDESMGTLNRDVCDEETWSSTIINELNDSRPLLYGGGSTSGAHELVIDGCDGNGYYHFNFGWGGASDGYYIMATMPFNMSPSITFGIKKNEGGKPSGIMCCAYDFMYNSESGKLVIGGPQDKSYCEIYAFRNFLTIYALAIENTDTHEISFFYERGTDTRFAYPAFTLTEQLIDGNYILYPVYRKDDESQYRKVLFRDNRQSFVDLRVENGKYIYNNNHIYNEVQDGAVEIDGICYFLDEATHEAEVTFRNDKYNSYNGDIKIPASVVYEGVEYTVTRIGTFAFNECDKLGILTVPKTVKFISLSFYRATLNKIVFEEGSELNGIASFAFQNAEMEELEIPEGPKILGTSTFELSRIKKISLPRSLKTIGDEAFRYGYLETLIVRWSAPLSGNFFYGKDLSTCTLYVPVGTKDIYRQTNPWCNFGTIIEDEALGPKEEGIFAPTSENTAAIIGDDNVNGNYTIPETVSQNGVEYTVTSIGEGAFNGNTSLTDVTLPASITSIGEGAFTGCNNLKTITVKAETPIAFPASTRAESGIFDGVDLTTCILYVPESSIDAYKSAPVWSEFKNIRAIGSTGINSVVFENGKTHDVFSLDGRKIRSKATSLDGLPKGVYIINGKKVPKR